VVGTPAKVKDFILKKVLRVECLKIVVVDEADEMLARGFAD